MIRTDTINLTCVRFLTLADKLLFSAPPILTFVTRQEAGCQLKMV